MNSASTPSPASTLEASACDASLLKHYTPTHLRPALWQVWRLRIIALTADVVAAHDLGRESRQVISRAIAGLLARLVSIADPEPGTPWPDLLTDAHISRVVAQLKQENRTASWVARSWQHLESVRRHMLDIGGCFYQAPPIAPPTPHVIPALEQLAELSPVRASEYAQLVLRDVGVFHPHPWNTRLARQQFRAINAALSGCHLTHHTVSWKNLMREQLWRWLNDDAPLMEQLAKFPISHHRIEDIYKANISHLSLKPSPELMRGSFQKGVARWEICAHSQHVARRKADAPKRTSPADVRRELRRKQQDLTNEPDPLPAKLEDALANWKPRKLTASEWENCKPVTTLIMRRSHIRGEESFRKHLRSIAPFVNWCLESGYEPTPAAMLTSAAIDQYTRVGMLDIPERTRADIRSDLRRVAAHAALSAEAPPVTPKNQHFTVKPPYTQREIESIQLAIRTQAKPAIAAKLRVFVSLGAGAGLDQRDMTGMTRSDIVDHGTQGIEITVRGSRPRTVWLRAEWEDTLRLGLADLGHRVHVLGSAEPAKDYIGDLYSVSLRCLEGGAHVTQSRLRNTWLTTLISEPISLWTIMQVAGLQTARTLVELTRFLTPSSDSHLTRGVR
jgi:hypothetical protein